MLTVYRILTYILLPFGAIIGMLTFISLTVSLGNLAALLPAFVFGCTVIYLVTSFNFLHRGVLYRIPQKPSLFDWIRVNGFVALFMGSLFIFESFYFRGNNELTETFKSQAQAMANEMQTEELPDVASLINWVLNFMLISGLLLNIHIILTFSFLKKFGGLFGKS